MEPVIALEIVFGFGLGCFSRMKVDASWVLTEKVPTLEIHAGSKARLPKVGPDLGMQVRTTGA